MSEDLVHWHDFNVALVTAAAGLLGLLFVALSIHVRALTAPRNAELRSVARSVFLGYVVALAIGFLALLPQTLLALGVELMVLVLLAVVPFGAAARSGLRATGIGYDRRVTVIQFVLGFALFAIWFDRFDRRRRRRGLGALRDGRRRDRQLAVGRVQHVGAALPDPVG